MSENRIIRFKIYLFLILISMLNCAYKGDSTGFALSVLMIPLAAYGAFHEQK